MPKPAWLAALTLGLMTPVSMPAPAAALPAVRDLTVPVVYTSGLSGLYIAGAQLNEVSPLFDPDTRGDVQAQGMTIHPNAWHSGGYTLWSPTQTLGSAALRGLFREGLKIEGPGQKVPVLYSDYGLTFQPPTGDRLWLVDWLDQRLRESGKLPDVSEGVATFFKVRSPAGTELMLISRDGASPPAELLRDHLRWSGTFAARVGVRKGERSTSVVSVARLFGGARAHALARQWSKERGALRVDAGNLVDDANDPDFETGFRQTMEQLPAMGFSAVVPFKHELSLPLAYQRQVANRVPFVAANLTPPDGVTVRPYVVSETGGARVAFVGLADTAELKRVGLLGKRTGWGGEDPLKAVSRVLRELASDRPDAVVLVTNLESKHLTELWSQVSGVSAILSGVSYHHEWSYRTHYEPSVPEQTRQVSPWIVTGTTRARVGMLTLGFRSRADHARLQWMDDEQRVVDDTLADPDPAASWAWDERLDAYAASESTPILPDFRRVQAVSDRLKVPADDPQLYYGIPQWSRLAANALRRATHAEVGVIHSLQGGSTLIGDIVRYVGLEWLPHDERVATLDLTGAQLRKLAALDAERSVFAWAGCDPDRQTVDGRPWQDGETYRVALTESLATSEAYASIFQEAVPKTAWRLVGEELAEGKPEESVSVREVTMLQLESLRDRSGGFTPDYLKELAARLLDDGSKPEPRWVLNVKPFSLSYQQFSVTNREPFGAVRNSLINTPDNTAWGARDKTVLTYEHPDYDWESTVDTTYQRLEVSVASSSIVQEQGDNLDLGSEFRLKIFKLQAADSALTLVPFVNGNFGTEFTPTVDQTTGALNPRRLELTGAAGAVLYPQTWLKQVRLGALGKEDLAVAGGRFQPGVQVGCSIAQPFGPLNLQLDVDLKNYFLTPEDTAADLGLLGQVGAGLEFPLVGGLGMRLGLDALLFTGKLASNRSLGTSLTPTLGLTYNASWKPALGISY